MLTMHPVVLRGRSGLELPPEEFAGRVGRVKAALAERGLDALIAFGDARHYAPLAWVCGLVPMLKWALVVVPAHGETELFTAMPGTRDLPAIRRIAVVGSVAPIGGLAAALARFDRVAVAGLPTMRSSTEATIRGATEVADGAEAFLAALMATPSQRERALLRTATANARAAAAAIIDAYNGGAVLSDALLAGDLAAREAGMHDVRVLWSADSGLTLRPLGRPTAIRPEPLVVYVAVETGGYWGEALRSSGSGARMPSALAPVARLGLGVIEGVEDVRETGFYSHRGFDEQGALRALATEVV